MMWQNELKLPMPNGKHEVLRIRSARQSRSQLFRPVQQLVVSEKLVQK